MLLLDAVPPGQRAVFEARLEQLRTHPSKEARATAFNHDHEHRVPPDEAADYATRLEALDTCPRKPACASRCLHGVECGPTNDMLCPTGTAVGSPPARLVSFITHDRLASILQHAGLDADTLATSDCYDLPSACCRIANEHTFTYKEYTRRDGNAVSLVWAADGEAVDTVWDADEVRDRLGTTWPRGSQLVAAYYPSFVPPSCHIPTVLEAQGYPRFQPSDPALEWGVTRDGRDNTERLHEYVHRAIDAGSGTSVLFGPWRPDGEVINRDPSNGYLEKKLA